MPKKKRIGRCVCGKPKVFKSKGCARCRSRDRRGEIRNDCVEMYLVGLTQRDIALVLGVSRARIHDLLTRERVYRPMLGVWTDRQRLPKAKRVALRERFARLLGRRLP